MRISEMTMLRDHWFPVLRSADLGVAPVGVELFGDSWVVWRDPEGLPAAGGDRCPHRGGSLSRGWVDGERIVCPYHGWEYGRDGACARIPYIDPGAPIPSKARLRPAVAQEAYGLVWMCVGNPSGPVPVWPEGESGDFELHVEFFEITHASALRVVDNALDLSHITFVHQGTFGAPGTLVIPPIPDVRVTPDGFVGEFTLEIPGVAQQMGVEAEQGARFERSTIIELLSPVVVRTAFHFSEFPDGSKDYGFFGVATPLDDERCIYVRVTALNRLDVDRSWDDFHEFSLRVLKEDLVILEAQPTDFSPNVVDEVHIRPDRLTLEYRRHLAGLLGGEV